MHLIAPGFAQALDLVRREIVDRVEFPGFKAPDRRCIIFQRIEDDLVQFDIGRIPVIGVLADGQVIVEHMVDKLEGAVRHHLAGFDEIRAILLKTGLVDGQRRLVRHQLDEEGRRPLERNLDGLGIDGLHAKLIERQFTLVDLFRILDGIKDIGVFGRRLRILDAAIGEDKVFRCDRRAIRPVGIGAKLECIDRAVIRYRPAFRRTRYDGALGIVDGQPFVEVLDDKGLDIDGCLGLVERIGFARIAPVQDRFGEGGTCGKRQRAKQDCGAQIELNRHHLPSFPSLIQAHRAGGGAHAITVQGSDICSDDRWCRCPSSP